MVQRSVETTRWVLLLAVVATAAVVAAAATTATEATLETDNFGPRGWTLCGAAEGTSTHARLAPAESGAAGGLWLDAAVRFMDWEVEFAVRTGGGTGRGEGLAFWYTDQPARTGTLFGAEPLFRGVGVVLDTADRGRGGPHPRALVLHNDGRYAFSERDHDHAAHIAAGVDGSSVMGELAGCPLPFPPGTPLRLRVRYEDRALTVDYHATPDDQHEQQEQQQTEWTRCCVVPRITLPVGYHFGFSAANSQLYEDHDLLAVTVRDLRNTAWSLPVDTPPPAQQQLQQSQQQSEKTASVGDVALLDRKLGALQRAVDELAAAVAAHTGAEQELATPELVRRVRDVRFELEQAANGLARQQSMLAVVAQTADEAAALLAGADTDLAAAERLQTTARAVLREQEGAARTRTRATYGSLVAALAALVALAAFQYWRLQHVEKSHAVRF